MAQVAQRARRGVRGRLDLYDPVVVHVPVPAKIVLSITEASEGVLFDFLDTTARTAEDNLSLEALAWAVSTVDHVGTEGIHIRYVNVTWEPDVDVVWSATVQSISHQSAPDNEWAAIR
ncbi:hypothetical protein D3C71_1285650 [compost metagenome]